MRQPSGRTERRLVSCVFIDVVGSTDLTVRLGAERMRMVLDEAFAEIRAVLQAQGGTIEKYAGDAIFALFGAPVAHADDPLRALRAAEAAVRWAGARMPGASPIDVRVGIETGEVLVDIEAVTTQRERMAVGACVNLAARLQSAAPTGHVLVGPICREATRDAADFTDFGTLDLKGFGPTPTFALVRVTERHNAALPFVGREREMAQLRAILARATSGEMVFAVALGPPGQGKTRLLEELLNGTDARILLARCRPDMENGEDTPLRQLLASESAPALAAIQQRVASVITDPTARERVTEGLAHSAGVSTFQRLAAMRPADRLQEFAAAWRAYLIGLARQRPVVLWVEDLHWAEPDVVRILDKLSAPGAGRVLVLASARPEFADSALVRRGENRLFLDLGPLGAEDARHLAESAGSANAIVERAEGNPLFIVELARARRTSGDMPMSVQGAISARLDELADSDRDLLQRAAVAGETFAVRDAAVLAEREPAEAAGALARLAHLRYLRPVEGGYRFHHALVREVAYTRLPVADRLRLHARYAQEGAEAADAVALAFHWWVAVGGEDAAWVWTDADELGRLRELACAAHLAAAEDQLERLSHERLLQLYERALALAHGADAKARAEAGIGLSEMRSASGDEGWRHYESALAHYRESSAPAPASIYADMLGFPLGNTGYFTAMPAMARMTELLDEGLGRAEAESDDVSRARLLALRYLALHDEAAGSEAEAIIAKSDPVPFADALRFLFSANATGQRFERAARLSPVLDRIIAAGAKLNVPEVRMWQALLAQGRGDLADARARAAQLADVARTRTIHTQGHALGVSAIVEASAGAWDAVAALSRETEALVAANPESTFCLVSAEAVCLGRVVELRARRASAPPIAPLIERMCPGLPMLRAALQFLPQVMAGEPTDDARVRSAYTDAAAEERALHDLARLIPATAMVIAERWDDLPGELAALDELDRLGAGASRALAAAVREEIEASRGGPAPKHEALRAIGFLGFSDLLRLRARTLATA